MCGIDPSRNAASCDSPGQRPGNVAPRPSRNAASCDSPGQRPGNVAPRPSRNAASCDSPGQRPGYAAPFFPQALKGRRHRGFALSGLGMVWAIAPRALPWAITACRVAAPHGPNGAEWESPGQRPGNAAPRPSRNAASCDSPGQRPGCAALFHQALTGRDYRDFALSGLGFFSTFGPRVAPWAITARPFGAEEGELGYGG